MYTSDPTVRKPTRPKIVLPKTCQYEPFLPTPEFLRDKNHKVEEYVPEPVTPNPVSYQYVAKPKNSVRPVHPIMHDDTIQNLESSKFAPKKDKVYKSRKRDKCLPTDLIPKDSVYWLPILERARKPDRELVFYYQTLCDKQRVRVYAYKTGQIDVCRKGVRVTIREPMNKDTA